MATDSIKLYTVIYIALVALATSKYLFFHTFDFSYWEAVTATLVAASLKTTLIVAYFQHLRWENRSLTALMTQALALFLLLMMAASYSVT